MAFLATASSAVLATDVTIPNTFTSGTAAVAAEVNDNFTAVKTAVDDNDGRITTNATAITTKADATAVTAEIAAAVASKANSADVTAAIAAAVAPKANSADVTADIAAAVAPKANSADVTADIAAAVAPKANSADVTALQQNGNPTGVACAGNDASDFMVRVGPLCVDKYEASVWDSASGGGTQFGDPDVGGDDYPCTDDANGCTATNTIYARSEAGVNPSSNITWFQAQQACAASGKRLLTNAEWQMAAAGTPDDVTTCVTGTLANTGVNNCSSNWGAADMVGNVWEWVADWVQGDTNAWAPSVGNAGGSFGDDVQSGTNPASATGGVATNMMSALYRGGRFSAGTNAGVFAIAATAAPAFSDNSLGFRCAR